MTDTTHEINAILQPKEEKVTPSQKSTYSRRNENVSYGNEPGETHDIDALLEREKQHNKTETWTKLDKTVKLQKLLKYTDKYANDNQLGDGEIKKLKQFFSECLEKNKLQKTKDVVYNKETKEIVNIPSLHFHSSNKNFTLKVLDAKRVSTIKSLTPKRIQIADKKPPINVIDDDDEAM
jgi:hypothetical protein